jgi:hypothetical protein
MCNAMEAEAAPDETMRRPEATAKLWTCHQNVQRTTSLAAVFAERLAEASCW